MRVRLSANDAVRLKKARRKLLLWFSRNGRSFFWRKLERNPYRVLVTEFMLQQTQTFRVEEFLPKFLKQFPTAKKLALASTADVVRAWQGLGYNRRAINLQRSAQTIVVEFNGLFPSDEAALRSLPGVGEYTARALQVFAFGKRVSVVDVNVIRVLSRITKKMSSTTTMLPIADIHHINTGLLPARAEKWHEALMDLGATICKSRPACAQCPVQLECASYPALHKAEHRPVGKNSNERIFFGKPKRIWRGEILKVITARKVSTSDLIKLYSHTLVYSPEFTAFVTQVADELVREGLCKKQGKYYH